MTAAVKECDLKPVLDEQVLHILMSLKPPKHWRETITQSIGDILGTQDLDKRLDEIRATIGRMDMRWDHGFITDENEFLQQPCWLLNSSTGLYQTIPA